MDRTGLRSKEAEARKAFFMKMRENSIKGKSSGPSSAPSKAGGVQAKAGSGNMARSSSTKAASTGPLGQPVSTGSSSRSIMGMLGQPGRTSSQVGSGSGSSASNTAVNSGPTAASSSSKPPATNSSANTAKDVTSTSTDVSQSKTKPESSNAGVPSVASLLSNQPPDLSSASSVGIGGGSATDQSKAPSHAGKSISTSSTAKEGSNSSQASGTEPRGVANDAGKSNERKHAVNQPDKTDTSTRVTNENSTHVQASASSNATSPSEGQQASAAASVEESVDVESILNSSKALQMLASALADRLCCNVFITGTGDTVKAQGSTDKLMCDRLLLKARMRGVEIVTSNCSNDAQVTSSWGMHQLDRVLHHIQGSDIIIIHVGQQATKPFPSDCFDHVTASHSWASSMLTTPRLALQAQAAIRGDKPRLIVLVSHGTHGSQSPERAWMERVKASAAASQGSVHVLTLDAPAEDQALGAALQARIAAHFEALLPVAFDASRSATVPDRSARRRLASTVVGREHDIENLNKAVDDACNQSKSIIGIEGAPGVGKSALVTAWLEQWEREHSSDLVVYHSFGTTSASRTLSSAMASLLLQLRWRADALSLPLSNTAEMARLFFEQVVEQQRDLPADGKVVVVLDDADLAQELYESERPAGSTPVWAFDFPVSQLPWLPRTLPEKMLLIATFRSSSGAHKALMKRKYDSTIVSIQPLAKSAAETLRLKLSTMASKATAIRVLRNSKVARFLQSEACYLPRRLEAAMSALLVPQSDQEAEQEHVEMLAECETLSEIYGLLLVYAGDLVQPLVDATDSTDIYDKSGMEADDEVVVHAMRLIRVAKSGIADAELRRLCGMQDPQFGTLFTILRDALRPLVAVAGGRLTFLNDVISLLVKHENPDVTKHSVAFANAIYQRFKAAPLVMSTKMRVKEEQPHRRYALGGRMESLKTTLVDLNYAQAVFPSGTLNLEQLDIDMEAAEVVVAACEQHNKYFRINMDNNMLGGFGAATFGTLLSKSTNITFLNLSNNMIKDEGLSRLLEAVNHAPSLTHLHLRVNGIGPDGAELLGEYLEQDTSLVDLNLEGNELGPMGTAYLSQGLESNVSLKSLNLMYNELGDEGAAHVAILMKRNAVINVGLRGNGITPQAMNMFPRA